MERVILQVVLVCFLTHLLSAQTLPKNPEKEAPETVFQTKLGDADVDLRLDGFWDASLSGSIGLAVVPGKGIQYPSVFPGFTDGLIYEQKPNLTLALWLMDRYFFETTLQEKRQLNSYVVGYQGKEGEVLQSIRAGNKGIEISPYPYMDFPGGSRSSPGIAARLQTEHTQHEFLLRYDPSQPVKKTYIGKNSVEELRIDPSAYVQGRFFLLPDTEVESVEVYLEDYKGSFLGSDGRRYRRATEFDVSLSRSEGLVSLQKSSVGRVVVYYEKGGLPVGSSSLGKKALPPFVKPDANAPWQIDPLGEGEDFSWSRSPYLDAPIDRFKVTIGGKPSLLLYDPGTFSPFQDYGAYATQSTSLSTGSNLRIRVVKRGSDTTLPLHYPIQPTYSPSESIIRMALSEGSRRSFQARFPFAEEAPLLYGPDSRKLGSTVDFEILIQTYTPIQSYSVSTDVIPGSVRVFRNGREEKLFGVDYEKGTVSLPYEPSSSDRIEIYYRTASGQGAGGDILFGMGSSVRWSDAWESKFALGVRWNVLKGSYSTEPTDHTGIVGLSTQVSYKKENLKFTTDGAIVYYNPDTSGLLRLLGMEGYDLTLEISKNNAFPSSIPDPAFYGGNLNRDNRGKLFFKNYETVDLLGGTVLNPYTWNPPAGAIFPYENGSLSGPYTASASSEGFNRVLVLDYQINSSEEWVGAQMNLSTGFSSSLDLSEVTAIRFAYKVVAHTGSQASLNFQVGAIGEDLDGDGILDEEVGASSRGFPFNQGTLTLYVGAGQEGLGNDQRDSEDANRNGILEIENPYLIFPSPGSSEGSLLIDASSRGDWKTALIRIPYTERSRLKSVRSVRFIIRKEGTGTVEGKILIGPIVFEGTTLPHQVVGRGEMEVREIYESLADIPPSIELEKVDPDRIKTFHSGGTDQKVLEVKWKNLGSGDKWVLYSPTREIPPEQYREVNLYIRTASLGGTSSEARYIFQYTDPEGKGVYVEIPALAENRWEKFTVDLVRKKAYLGGRELSNVRVDTNFGKLTRFLWEGSGAKDGVVYLDELHLSRPQAGWGFAGSLEGSFSIPGTVVTIGDMPLLRNVSVAQKLSARTQAFQGRLPEETPSLLSSSTEGSIDLLGLFRTEGSFAFDRLSDRIQYEAGHRLQFPAEGGLVTVRDQFKRSYHTEDAFLSRMNRIEVNIGPPFALSLGAESTFITQTLTQSWDTTLSSTPISAFSLRFGGKLSHIAEGYTFGREPYTSSWIHSYRLVFPYTSGVNIQREGLFRWETQLESEIWGVRITPEVSYVNTGEKDGLQRTVEKLLIEVPLRSRDHDRKIGNSFTVSYLRQGTNTRSVPQDGDFPSDFSTVKESIYDQAYFYRSYPFYELIIPGRWSSFATDTIGLTSAEYVSQIGVSFSRSYGSYWQDLVVPAQGEGSYKKIISRSKDTLTSTNQFDLSLLYSALNLFGLAGAYPFSAWWYTDEYQHKHTLSILYKEEEATWQWKISSQQKVTLFGEKDEKATLEHFLYLEETDRFSYWGSLTLGYTWKGLILRDFGTTSLRRAKDLGAFYLHTEKIEYRYEDKEGWKQYLVLGHETALTFPKYGYIKAEIRLGLGFEEDYSGLPPGYRILIGLSGGISAHFTF
ncbi:MAG: hypothetical protein N2442_09625 [Spirochaetes bacterium]|nr:hypothetical protein [Spirochaetota bacterium]